MIIHLSYADKNFNLNASSCNPCPVVPITICVPDTADIQPIF